MTEDAARELAEEAVRFGRRGRPAVDPEVGPGERSPRVTFRVPAQTRRRLEQRAREEGRPVADVLRAAVEHYLR
ncbi:MAG: ribbon-helix-helix protein, CopG family [Pseudonocardiaceae bacterium]